MKIKALRYFNLSFNTFSFYCEFFVDETGYLFLPLENSRVGFTSTDKFEEVANCTIIEKKKDSSKFLKIIKCSKNERMYIQEENSLFKKVYNNKKILDKLENL